ncbi:hypothetical protein [Sabulibacter ruber]|uniref:hypothetical protein n=1 Tax=Sabulibacter ruber TaxID=2811901 RepID=UPI001A95B896|nr:hypothetical protein [Sabulibacter ruber]
MNTTNTHTIAPKKSNPYLTLFFSCFLAVSFWSCSAVKTKAYFIPTLHSLHKTNQNYSYDSLRALVARLNPDIIAVEIRPEDMGEDSSYLKQNYPFEMRMMRYWFPNAALKGFDWLGSDIEGKLIPANYWKEISAIKQWEKAKNADSVYSKRSAACSPLSNERTQLLQRLSLQELLSSKDAELTRQFYQCLSEALKGSIHERVLNFYDQRNEKILVNLKQILRENKGKRIVILTGDDHYILLQDKLRHSSLF